MTRTDRPLDNPLNWSFAIGRLFGIRIRIHILFLICAVILLWMELLPTQEWADPRTSFTILLDAVGTYGLLFFIVLVHEFGHCFGSRFTGGTADEILLWPLGGLAFVQPPHQPAAHMITAFAGPLVNVAFCAISSVTLVAWTGLLGSVPWNPIHPWSPVNGAWIPTVPQEWLIRFFGLSYFLLLVNLLPIYPFDGGRILHAWLWTTKGYRTSLEIATGTGMVGAIAVGLLGLFTDQSWITLSIAAFGYLTCWQQRRMLREQGLWGVDEFGYESGCGGFEQEPDRKKPGFLARRKARKAAQEAERLRREEEEHQVAVDAILRKVAQYGRASLSPLELRILERETTKLRMKSDN